MDNNIEAVDISTFISVLNYALFWLVWSDAKTVLRQAGDKGKIWTHHNFEQWNQPANPLIKLKEYCKVYSVEKTVYMGSELYVGFKEMKFWFGLNKNVEQWS